MATPEQNKNIKWALTEFRKPRGASKLTRDQAFKLYLDYYEGRHKLTFATEKFKTTFGETFQAMAENLCPVVVDVLADKLQVQGYTSRNDVDSDLIATETAEISRRNRLDKVLGQCRRDALLLSENYVIVWPDKDDETQPVVYPNAPGSMVVKYDTQKLNLIVQAAKFWIEDGKCFLNLYFPDRIEKYVTKDKATGLPANPDAFVANVNIDERWPLPNPYDQVPIFAYINNAGSDGIARSEIDDVIPLQNGLNKALCDMLVAMEFEAFAQRYVTGLEVEYDPDTGAEIQPFKAGIDRMMRALDKDVKFGEFSRADLSNFIEVQNNLRGSIARVAGFPLHYFNIGSDTPPSGTSLIVATARLTSKVNDRQISFGETDEDLMRFCLKIRGIHNADVKVLWVDSAPKLDDVTVWDAANKQMAVTGRNQVLRDRGYSPDEIDQMAKERWEEEMGDGAPLDDNQPAPVEEETEEETTTEVLPEGAVADAGVVTTQTLNGTQISSAMQVIQQFKSGEIFEKAATELLVSVGLLRDRVAAIIAEIRSKVTIKPKQPTEAPQTAPESPTSDDDANDEETGANG
jgi:hypothetical protein